MVEVSERGDEGSCRTGAGAEGESCGRARASVLGLSPHGFEPPRLLHAMEGWIERALFDPQRVGGHLLDTSGDPVAMLRVPAEGFEDEEVEGPLEGV